MRPTLLQLLPALLLLSLPATAQQVIVGGATAEAPDAGWIAAAGLICGLILLGLVAAALHRSVRRMAEWCGEALPGASATEIQAARLKAFAGMKALPLGVPEGSVRAAIGVFIVVLGLGAIVFQRALGLGTTGEIAGLLGTVLGFYFGARSSGAEREAAAETARQAVERAAEAEAGRVRAEAEAAGVRAEALRAEAHSRAASDTEERTKLAEAGRIAAHVRAAADAIAAIAPDLPIAREAARAAGIAETTLAVVAQAGAGDLAGAAARAAALASDLAGNDPLATLLAEGARGLTPVLANAGGIAAAVGGPLGLAGAVIAGAIGAVRVGAEHYRRWTARVLDRPYGLDLYPEGLADAPMALAALEASPIFRRAYAEAILLPRDLAAARALMQAALSSEAAALIEAGDGALPPRPIGTAEGFASALELAEGLNEFRRALLDRLLDDADPAPVSVPLPGRPIAVPQRTLRAALDAAREDLAGAAALDRLALAAARLARSSDIDLAAALARAEKETG